jgi:hypothetical protein
VVTAAGGCKGSATGLTVAHLKAVAVVMAAGEGCRVDMDCFVTVIGCWIHV